MEIWKPVIDFEGIYSISRLGRVRRDKPGRSTHKGLILKPASIKKYPYVHLIKGTYHTVKRIHFLVAQAFLGPKPIKTVIDHIDRDKGNNNLENLRYISQSINVKNSHRTDNYLIRQRKIKEKLNLKSQLYKQIKIEIEENKLTSSQIAKKYEIPYITIYCWKNGLRNKYFSTQT